MKSKNAGIVIPAYDYLCALVAWRFGAIIAPSSST
jgi:hypothetical protein